MPCVPIGNDETENVRRKAAPITIIVLLLTLTIDGCSMSRDQSSPTTLKITSGDVTLTICRQDNTQLIVSGSVLNHSSVVSDYSFVVEGFNDGAAAGQVGVTKNSVAPGLVAPWSSEFTIPGGLGGSFTCRLRSVYRVASPS